MATNKGGRPTKYTEETVNNILVALRGGNTRKTAAAIAGIDQVTMIRWMHRYASFAKDVEKAEATAEGRHVQNIVKAAAEGTWTASAWWLERRRHQEWGRKDRAEILHTVRELARSAGADENAAIAEAEAYLKEIRSGARG